MDYQENQLPFQKKLLKGSKYRKKIDFLLANQPIIPERYWNISEGSSCFGTVVYLLGMQDKVKESWKNRGNDLNYTSCALGNYIKDRGNMPQYVGEDPFNAFLEDHCKEIEGPQSNSIITYSYKNNNTEDCGFRLRHSGIVLPIRNNQQEWTFEQRGFGLEFELIPLNSLQLELGEIAEPFVIEFENVVRRHQEMIETLEIKFYKTN